MGVFAGLIVDRDYGPSLCLCRKFLTRKVRKWEVLNHREGVFDAVLLVLVSRAFNSCVVRDIAYDNSVPAT